MIARLEGRLEALERHLTREPEREDKQPASLPLDDLLSSESPQEILDSLQEDPKAFIQGLEERAAQRIIRQQTEEKAQNDFYEKLRGGLDSFGEKYDDFIPQMDKFLKTVEDNPHHNVVSAYYEEVLIPKLESDIASAKESSEAALKTAREEGFAAGKKEAIKEIRAKGAAASLDGSQSTQGSNVPNAELDDVKHGTELREKLVKDLVSKRAAS